MKEEERQERSALRGDQDHDHDLDLNLDLLPIFGLPLLLTIPLTFIYFHSRMNLTLKQIKRF